MARIAFVIPALHGGGAEFVAGQWAAELTALGHHVVVVTTHSKPDAPRPPDFTHIALPRRGSFVTRVRELRRLIRRERYDIVMGLMPHWNVLSLLATRGLGKAAPKVVVSGRNMESSLRRVMGMKYRAELVLARMLYRKADAYVAISHPVAAEAIAIHGLLPSGVWVVPNPATGKIDRAAAREERARRVAEASPGEINIVVPARLVEQKRPILALDVAVEVRRRVPEGMPVRVHYFGSGPLEKRVLEAAAERAVDVVLHGWVEHWFQSVPPGSVMLLSSHSEGFGNVLVEAAAFGVPVVASSRALGVADAIIPGVTGMLAAGDRAEDFAAALTDAARITIPVSDVEGWLDHFSRDTSTAGLWTVFSSLGARNGLDSNAKEKARTAS